VGFAPSDEPHRWIIRFLVLDPALKAARKLTDMGWYGLPPSDGFERWAAFGLLHSIINPQMDDCASAVSTQAACTGFLIATNPDTRTIDTVTSFYDPPWAGGFASHHGSMAVMADGSVAVLHARDYRVEWINGDRSRTLGPRIRYEWRVLPEPRRARIADSINLIRSRQYALDVADWKLDSADVADTGRGRQD